MNPDGFYNKYKGQSLLYAPNKDREHLRGECVQPIHFYVTEFWGKPTIWRDAHQWFTHNVYPEHYDRIANNPNDPNQIPPKGAIIVWSASLPGSGGVGHIAILAYVNNGGGSFVSYDSNWGGRTLKAVTHDWKYVVGWLVPKGTPAASIPPPVVKQGDEMIATRDEAIDVYKTLRPNGNPSEAEIVGTAGRRSYKEFMITGRKERDARDASLRAQAEHMNNMQGTINHQNQIITDLNQKLHSTEATAAEKQAALNKALEDLAGTTSELTSTRDQMQELQEKVTETPEPKPNNSGFLVQLLAKLLKKK